VISKAMLGLVWAGSTNCFFDGVCIFCNGAVHSITKKFFPDVFLQISFSGSLIRHFFFGIFLRKTCSPGIYLPDCESIPLALIGTSLKVKDGGTQLM